MEDTTVGRERVQGFDIIRRATAVPSVMVDDATSGGVPLANANKSPTIAPGGNSVGNSDAGASARSGGALGW